MPTKNVIEVLEDYNLFDSEAEIEYDNITFLASKICNTSISTITLLDDKRQWFKSKIGFEHSETPLNRSFCALSISKSKNVIVVPNVMKDAEFSIIGKLNGLEKDGFYAAVTLFNEDEIALGTLCVIDYESKNLDQDQIKALQILGKQVEELFKIRLKNIMKDIMQIEKTKSYVLSGKSGWGMRNEINNGWLVGYLETNTSVYFFATNVEKQETNMDEFPVIRLNSTKEAFRKLKLIK